MNRVERIQQTEEITAERLLDQLAKAQGSEAHASEVVATECMLNRFRYAPALGWLQWDGRRWDDDPAAEDKVRDAVRQFNMQKERDFRARSKAAETQADMLAASVLTRAGVEVPKDPKAMSAALQDAMSAGHVTEEEFKAYNAAVAEARTACKQADIWSNLQSLAKISSLVKLSRAMDGILTYTTEFDAHPDLLNCHNVVVNLRTGETQPHDPDLLITKLAGGDYVPGAKHPAWEKALKAVHPDAVQWLQERMGQSFTGHRPPDDSLVISAGGGENGKSAVMEAFLRAAGAYGDIIDHKVLLADPNQHSTEKMDLRGLRLAYMDETPEEGRLDTQRLKGVVGTAKIKARHMHKNTVTFEATHTMWINTNFLPQVDSTDHGTWRRLFAMPWPFKFRKPWEAIEAPNERKGDLTLKPTLETHPDVPAAVLAWVVRGAVAHFARTEPARPPAAVEAATKAWRGSSDVGMQFAAEMLAAAPGHFISAEEMFTEFREFLKALNKREWSKPTVNSRFPSSLEAAGIIVQRTPQDVGKILAGMVQSHAPKRMDSGGWQTQPAAPGPVDIATGRAARVWLGVRFRTEAEQGQVLHEAM